MQQDKLVANLDSINRQIEINEWSYQNKLDTLFLFQIIFIALAFITVLMFLRSIGVIGIAFIAYLSVILVGMIILIIVNRAMFSGHSRDTRYWNKLRFNEDNKKTNQTTIPPGMSNMMDQYFRGQQAACKACPGSNPAPVAAPPPGVLPSDSPARTLSNITTG